jgi:hypothetical protein
MLTSFSAPARKIDLAGGPWGRFAYFEIHLRESVCVCLGTRSLVLVVLCLDNFQKKLVSNSHFLNIYQSF